MPQPKKTQDWLDEIARLIDRPARGTSRGGTEPKAVLTDIVDALGLDIDPSLPKPKLAEAIARRGGQPWDSTCDSESTPSGGGGTITNEGLDRVLRSVRNLKQNDRGQPRLGL